MKTPYINRLVHDTVEKTATSGKSMELHLIQAPRDSEKDLALIGDAPQTAYHPVSNTRSIGLVELPVIKLLDPEGRNWTVVRKQPALGSKLFLSGALQKDGHSVELINLKAGSEDIELGSVQWKDLFLRKLASGIDWRDINPKKHDVLGITVNYLQEREVACAIISYLSTNGGNVVVGGSDAFSEPKPYLDAGAKVIVRDKSGASNNAALQIALGEKARGPYRLVTPFGQIQEGSPRLHPNEWGLPSIELAKATLGYEHSESIIPDHLLPIGVVMDCQGCDRKCDFCETPTYGLGYQYMSPEQVQRWLTLQKEAGAHSIMENSDQFLGRILRPEGRNELLQIMASFRSLKLPVLWGNGLELSKTTMGRGLESQRNHGEPDFELVNALWGWDGERGCAQAYLPAERPLEGHAAYKKLLDWNNHVNLLKAIVAAGVPDITYGIIIGLPDDSHESFNRLHTAIGELHNTLMRENPALKFRVTPFAIRPIPGTPKAFELEKSGLLRFKDPAIAGGFWTACADTHHMSYQEVSDWQFKFLSENNEPGYQGLSALK